MAPARLRACAAPTDHRFRYTKIYCPESIFQGWELKTTSGDVLTVLQGHWRGNAASLILLDGRETSVPASKIVSFDPMQQSVMPEGLAALFSVEELRDLAADLDSLE